MGTFGRALDELDGPSTSLEMPSLGLPGTSCFRPAADVASAVVPRASRPSLALSTNLARVFGVCNPSFYYNHESRPKRYLTDPPKPVTNCGQDNENKDLIVWMGKHIEDAATGTTYWIRRILGQGTFGQVLHCVNMTTKEPCAVKIIKNDQSYYNQSKTEVKMLQHLNMRFRAEEDGVHVVQLLSRFDYANHLCLVFEILRENLFEVIEQNGYRGLSLQRTVRPIITQVLTTLAACAKLGIVHCDLKPENILLQKMNPHSDDIQIKLIDFGSACEENNTVYSYIQSRFYRAPEVLLGVDYTCMIDIWSLGCVAAELYLGLPLLPGTNDYNQLYRMIEMIGFPPKHLLQEGTRTHEYFKKLDRMNGDLVADQEDEEPEPAPLPSSTPGKRPRPPPPKILPSDGYKLKSEDEYYEESGEERQPFKRYFTYHKLYDIIAKYSTPKEIREEKDEEKKAQLLVEQKLQRGIFTDFLHGLLHTDPHMRWPAAVALKHPFISGAAYNGDGAFHTDVAEPERLRRNRQRAQSIFSQNGASSAAGGGGSLPPGTGAWGASAPIDMRRGAMSPGCGLGTSATPSSSFAQSPMPPGMFGGSEFGGPMGSAGGGGPASGAAAAAGVGGCLPGGGGIGASPVPPGGIGGSMAQSSLGTSFPGASCLGSSYPTHAFSTTPTPSQHGGMGGGNGAVPIPIPTCTSFSDAYGSSLPGSSFPSHSWMDSSSYINSSTLNSHSSPPQQGLGTSPSLPVPMMGGGGGGGGSVPGGPRQHHSRKGGPHRAGKRQDIPQQGGSVGGGPAQGLGGSPSGFAGTSPGMGAPPSYPQSQPMPFARPAAHVGAHGNTPTTSFQAQPQMMMNQYGAPVMAGGSLPQQHAQGGSMMQQHLGKPGPAPGAPNHHQPQPHHPHHQMHQHQQQPQQQPQTQHQNPAVSQYSPGSGSEWAHEPWEDSG